MMTEERRIVQITSNTDAEGIPTCPHCGCQQSEVTNTYPWSNGTSRRRRVCSNCDLPFHTVQPSESIDDEDA